MAVTTETNRTDELTTDGVATDFDFAMLIHDESEVQVWYEPDGGSYDQLALNTDYGVIFTEAGGTVGTDGYRAPLAAGKVLIIRHLEFTQQTNWLYLDNHSEQQHQDDFDRSVMRDIQIQEQLDRVLMLAIHSSTTGITCPEPVANYLLGWNAAGTNLTNISPLAIAVLIAEEVIAGSIPEVLTDLTDVSFDAPAVGDVLRYDGGQWTKYADSNYQSAADGLDDISALAKTDSNFIVGDGSQWVAESGATARTSLGLDSIIADLVPYTGATEALDLGEQNLITDGRVYGDLHSQGFDFSGVTGIQVVGVENSAFKPEHDNKLFFGDTSFRWKNIFSYLGNFSGNVTIGGTLGVTGESLFSDKIKFTQVDGNEFIDSLNDGYVDYGATTAHRFNNDVFITGGLGIGVSSVAANTALYVYNPADADAYIYLRAGEYGGDDRRCYLGWKDMQGDDKWYMGRNATNDFILYDQDNGLHCFKHFDGAATHIASGGSGAITLNWIDTAGTGGVLIYSGGASPALIYSMTANAFHSYTDTMHLDNASGITSLDIDSADNNAQLRFYTGATLKYSVKYDLSNDRLDIWDDVSNDGITIKDGLVGIGDTTPSYKLQVGGTFSVLNSAYFSSSIHLNAAANYLKIGYGSELRLVEPGQSTASYTGFKAPALAANVMYTMPTADGAASSFLQTDGAGALSWAASGSGFANVATGSYTGDGTESKAITGVGFQPVYVRTVQKATVPSTAVVVCWTSDVIIDDHADKATIVESSGVSQMLTKAIISLDADGFTVSDAAGDLDPNKNGVDYNYVAFGP